MRRILSSLYFVRVFRAICFSFTHALADIALAGRLPHNSHHFSQIYFHTGLFSESASGQWHTSRAVPSLMAAMTFNYYRFADYFTPRASEFVRRLLPAKPVVDATTYKRISHSFLLKQHSLLTQLIQSNSPTKHRFWSLIFIDIHEYARRDQATHANVSPNTKASAIILKIHRIREYDDNNIVFDVDILLI